MKNLQHHHDPSITQQDPWEKLKQFTDARIALGRAGCSIPTRAMLDFQLSHAQAKDAVFQSLDVTQLQQQLTQLGLSHVHVHSQATDKESYLKRPDLGRILATEARQHLIQQSNMQQKYDVCIVIGDGLSAAAVQENALPLIQALEHAFEEKQWSLAPIVIATGARVAIGDEVAQIFKAPMLIMLIGERPGLSSPKSMGLYYTFKAQVGSLDAQRNCISNIRPAGLSIAMTTQRLLALIQRSNELGLSGVQLKDEYITPALEHRDNPKHLF